MSKVNEDLVFEYLIENLSKDLVKKYPFKTILMLDYCYKKDEQVPQDHFSGFISKVVSKQTNSPSKSINLNNSELADCLFLESYKYLLSNKTQNLIKIAKTAKDFKAIIAIDTLAKKVNNSSIILNSSSDLDSKVFHLAKTYEKDNFEKKIKKEYDDMRAYSLEVNAYLKKPLTSPLVKKFSEIKKEMDNKLSIYSKYPDQSSVADMQRLMLDTKQGIEKKLSKYIDDINLNYHSIKRIFDNRVWDNERKVNRLINLRAELESINAQYKLVLHNEGIRMCNSLDSKIKDTIFDHEYVKDKKEEFKEVKRRVYDYRKEADHMIIGKEGITYSGVNKINRTYSTLQRLSNQEFHDCVPSAWQENYYSNIQDVMNHIKQRCSGRVLYLVDKSTKCRQKVDNSFFSWQTKKFTKKLKGYNDELEVWSKCRII